MHNNNYIYIQSSSFSGVLNITICTAEVTKGRVKVNYLTSFLTCDTGLPVQKIIIIIILPNISPFWNWNLERMEGWKGEWGVIYSQTHLWGASKLQLPLFSVSGTSHGGYCNIRGMLPSATAANPGAVTWLFHNLSLSKNLTLNLPLLQTWCIFHWNASKS